MDVRKDSVYCQSEPIIPTVSPPPILHCSHSKTQRKKKAMWPMHKQVRVQEPQATSQDVHRSENIVPWYQDRRLEEAEEALVVTTGLVSVAVVDGRGRRGRGRRGRSGNDRALLANGGGGGLNGSRALGGKDEGGELRGGGNRDTGTGRSGVAETTGGNGGRSTDRASLGQEARGSTSARGKSAVTDGVRGRDISGHGGAVRGRGGLSRNVSRADVLLLSRDLSGGGRLASGDSDGLLLSDSDSGSRSTLASAASTTSGRNNGTSTLNRDVLASAVAVSRNVGSRGRGTGVNSDELGGGGGRLKSGVGGSLILAAGRSSLGLNALLGGRSGLVRLSDVDSLVDGLGGGGSNLGGHSVGRRASANGVDESLGGDVDLLSDGSADSLNNSRGLVTSAITVTRDGRSVGSSGGGSLRGGGGQLRLGANGGGERDGAGDQDGGRSRAVSDGLSAASRGEDLGGVDDRCHELRAIVSRVGDSSDGERRETSADGSDAGHNTSSVASAGESWHSGSLGGSLSSDISGGR